MTEFVGRPAYQQVADDLRQKMASGELPVGAAIPSTAEMTRQYGVSSTVVRAAVNQLRSEGLLIGRPGKGVFVRAVPGAAAGRVMTLDDLARQVAELREIGSAERARGAEIDAEVVALRQRVTVLQRHLTELYERLGVRLPDELTTGSLATEKTVGR